MNRRSAARVLALALALWSLFGAPRGLAADDASRAREFYGQAKQLFEAGQFAEAAEAFREANRLNPNWKIYYNIGQCEAMAKRHGLALEAFEAYLSQGGDEIGATRKEEVLAEVDRLQKIVGLLDVKAPDGAQVIVDGVARETTPLPGPLMIAAGVKHDLLVKLADETLLVRSIKVSGGKTVRVDTAAPAEEEIAAPLEPAPDEDPDDSRALRTAGWVAVGAGGALAIGGAIAGGLALSISADLEDDCPDEQCAKEHWGEMDRMDRTATASNVLLIGGGVIAATGIVLLIVDASRESGEPADTALAPVWGPGTAGLSVVGRF